MAASLVSSLTQSSANESQARASLGVSRERIPKHIAIIMDGNGRWAQARGLARTEGHQRGAESVRTAVRSARKLGVKYLTLYAFSVANWDRPALEVRALMQLLANFAQQEKFELQEQGIRLEVIGDIDELPHEARKALDAAMKYTAEGDQMTLSLALSYGARTDIARAARSLALKVQSGELLPEEVDEKRLAQEMTTARLPDVDLLIRTSGETRVSDFLLYESAYAELLFLPIMWPEFGERHLSEAIEVYASRERRFGLTGAQARRQIELAPESSGTAFDPLDTSLDPASVAASLAKPSR